MRNRSEVRGSRFAEQQPLTEGEQGYMLLMLIVAIGIILIGLSVAATKVAFSLRREREVESMRRADQYVRAIRLYYKKLGHYPGSIEQLENTNNIRFLRQRYMDPLTGKPDYRLILVGQNKTTVKGFFGQPLTGLATTGLGAAAGMQSAGVGGPGVAAGAAGASGVGGVGGAAGFGAGAAAGAAGAGAAGTGAAGSGAAGSGAAGAPGATGTGATGSTDASGSSPGGTGNQPGTAFGAGNGPFMGVGTSAKGPSINTPNEQTAYENWEFLWDPRLELLKQKAALNAGVGSTGAGSLGTTPGGFGSTPTSGAGAGAGSGTGGAGPTGGTPARPQQ